MPQAEGGGGEHGIVELQPRIFGLEVEWNRVRSTSLRSIEESR